MMAGEFVTISRERVRDRRPRMLRCFVVCLIVACAAAAPASVPGW